MLKANPRAVGKSEYCCLHLSLVNINIYDYDETVYHENLISVTASDFIANLGTGTHRVSLDQFCKKKMKLNTFNTSVMHTYI